MMKLEKRLDAMDNKIQYRIAKLEDIIRRFFGAGNQLG